MNILIIGSKGFIGSHCLQYFERDNNVYGCDVVVDYVSEKYFLISPANIDFKEIFERNNFFDICINCSGAASVPESIKNPRRDFELNTHNVFNLLDAIRQFSPNCKLIQISSAAVYEGTSSPIKESNPLAPISPYGWHKLYSEQLCKQYVQIYNSKVVILRPFSVYGKGLKKQLFWDVYNKIKKNEPFELYGSGNETRDFIHITDLLFIIELIIKKGNFSGEVYNAANGLGLKINDIINTFVALSGSKVTFTFNNKVKEGDPLYWQADINKIKTLGYFQKTSLTDGLKEYLQWAEKT
ncbi:MAG TPA: SDR family oxidoreductase [Ferruginibacter sp.]|nr:SDR family oxidoreductase [Ferruginibacter sp.]